MNIYQSELKAKQQALLRKCQGLPDRSQRDVEQGRNDIRRRLQERAEREHAEMLAEQVAKAKEMCAGLKAAC